MPQGLLCLLRVVLGGPNIKILAEIRHGIVLFMRILTWMLILCAASAAADGVAGGAQFDVRVSHRKLIGSNFLGFVMLLGVVRLFAVLFVCFFVSVGVGRLACRFMEWFLASFILLIFPSGTLLKLMVSQRLLKSRKRVFLLWRSGWHRLFFFMRPYLFIFRFRRSFIMLYVMAFASFTVC